MANNNHVTFGAGHEKVYEDDNFDTDGENDSGISQEEAEDIQTEDQESFREALENSAVWQAVRPEPRREGQDAQSYVKENVMKTGFIGAVTGLAIGVASFVAKVAGTVIRNLLWDERMQNAISARMEKGTEKQKEEKKEQKKEEVKNDTKNADKETYEKKEEKKIDEKKIKEMIREAGGEIHGNKVTFTGKDGERYTIKAADLLDPKRSAGTFYQLNGREDRIAAGMEAVVFASKLSGESKDLDIPTPAGDINVAIHLYDEDKCRVFVGEKEVLHDLSRDLLYDKDLFEAAFRKSLSDVAVETAVPQLTKEFTYNGLTLHQDMEGNLNIAKKGMEPICMQLRTPEDGKAIVEKLKENKIPAKTAEGVVAFFRPEAASTIEHGKSFREGAAHMDVSKDGIAVRTPTMIRVAHNDAVKQSEPVPVSASPAQIRKVAEIPLTAAVKAKLMKPESQFLTKVKDQEIVVTRYGDGMLRSEPLEKGNFARVEISGFKDIGKKEEGQVLENSRNGKMTILTDVNKGESYKGLVVDGKVHYTCLNCSLHREMEERTFAVPEIAYADQKDFTAFLNEYKDSYDEVKHCRGVAEDYKRPETVRAEGNCFDYFSKESGKEEEKDTHSGREFTEEDLAREAEMFANEEFDPHDLSEEDGWHTVQDDPGMDISPEEWDAMCRGEDEIEF